MMRKLIFGFCLLCLPFTTVFAQTYPSRPITILVGLAAGGVSDVMTRIYAASASKRLGQPIIIENRPTGSGAVAASALQSATPDG